MSAIVIANSQITKVTDSAGRVWQFGYTGSELTTITDPLGNVTTFGYTTPGGQLNSITRPRTPYGKTAADVVWTIGYVSGSAPSAVANVVDPIEGEPANNAVDSFTYGPTGTTVSLARDANQQQRLDLLVHAAGGRWQTPNPAGRGYVYSVTDGDGGPPTTSTTSTATFYRKPARRPRRKPRRRPGHTMTRPATS